MRLPAEQRYLTDPIFHQLVDLIRYTLKRTEMTPTEVREAAVLACTFHEQETIRPPTPFPRA